MTLLNGVLLLALLGALAWGFWLRGQLRDLQRKEPPPPETFNSLFRATVASLDVGLFILDKYRNITYLNPKAESLFRIHSEEALGRSMISIMRDYEADELISQAARTNEPCQMVLRPILDGSVLQLYVYPLLTEEVKGMVLVLRDITHVSLLERARRDMVANVSHELRTPLASVKLLVETLQTEPPPQIAQRMLGQMNHEVDAVTQLVDELHELSQIESGRMAMKLSPAPIEPVLQRAVERIQPQAERKALQVSEHVAAALPLVNIDEQRIGQVMLNLLYNALKFTSEGSIQVGAGLIAVEKQDRTSAIVRQAPPDVPLWVAERISLPQPLEAGEWLLITVSDSGIGIPAEEVSRVFERFYKVDRARTRNASGTGLGLAIAKHLIEGHGGAIWASSAEGEGSTFYIALPVA
jgi:two-component system phosphate regulon sensor histidine kinase PhoR